ncbi:hypothetical protein JTE90_003607 [Oedothorax gibbosus]|uniref:Uncharacterized protein n=1 Tax=Oedothorax gibbosus TaxID=931172 RepID=A0AAV6VEB4_9ARAC|nr:hypothetical protein JTE90_003607 [Oedothorax gibbosus]
MLPSTVEFLNEYPTYLAHSFQIFPSTPLSDNFSQRLSREDEMHFFVSGDLCGPRNSEIPQSDNEEFPSLPRSVTTDNGHGQVCEERGSKGSST